MSEYKRLTTNNLEEYDPEYNFCIECKYFGEPNGCNRPNGTCDSYDRFMETYNRLVELEDKIENGTLRDFPCTVGDEVFWAWDLDKQHSQVMRGLVIGLSIYHKNTVWFSVKYDDFYQTSTIRDSLSGSLSSMNILKQTDLIYGRMPQNEY